MPWFDYRQNNSGGSFHFDAQRGISVQVWVEAASASEADERAESLGLYFDGSGDCQCCGNRWHTTYSDGEVEAPTSVESWTCWSDDDDSGAAEGYAHPLVGPFYPLPFVKLP